MRAREFILKEYTREKTAGVFGKKLLAAILKDNSRDTTIKQIRTYVDQKNKAGGEPDTKLILDKIMMMLENTDPTPNKEYVQWLAKVYANEGVMMEDLVSKTRPWLELYDLYKKKRFFTGSYANFANIMNLTWKDLWEISIRADFQMMIQRQEEKAMPKGDAEQVYENDKVRIVVPKDQTAACYYGQGTQWCTASTQSHNYFNQYNREGPLYILLPKKPQYEGEKYQLHFPSGQFMDVQDRPVDVIELLDMRFGSDLIDFFREREPAINDWLVFTPDEMLEPLINKIRTAVDQHVSEIVSEWETTDDYWYEYLREKYPYPEGHEEEGDINWEAVQDADESYTDWNYDAADYIARINGAIDLTPGEVKALAQEAGSEWGADNQTISDLDNIMAHAIEQTNTRNAGDGGVVEWIHDHIYIKKRDDRWDVSLLYVDNEGKRKEYAIH